MMKPSNARTLKCSRFPLFALALVLASVAMAQPQPLLIDRIIAVVGQEAILYSELTARLDQAKQGGATINRGVECAELEDLLYEKLLLEQARIDSVVVDEAQVTAELERRIRYFAQQLGGETALEKFYGKSITEIKADFREQVQDQLLVQNMQQRITADIRVTPRDVQRFFQKIPTDSVPLVSTEVEYAELLRIPKPSEEEERRVRRKIDEHREAVLKGTKDFCTVAILYSEDPGSAKECGQLGMVPLGVMVPEFDAVAMSLKENEVSQVFKTQFGYHFMQLIERKGERYNARHVLMRPQVGSSDLQSARSLLDSVVTLVRGGKMEFGAAVVQYSDDEESKGTNGLMIEPNSNSARWDLASLDQQTFFVLDKLKVGEVSDPQLIVMPDGSKAYRLLNLLARGEPHRANMKDDYRLIHQAAEGKIRSQAIDAWVKERLAGTYVHLADGYTDCPLMHDWTGRAGVSSN